MLSSGNTVSSAESRMIFGDYRIDKNNVIGKGTFGTVYKGTCEKTGETIVAKEITLTDVLPEFKSEMKQKMQDEISGLELGQRHPNIVKYISKFPQGESVWIMMEFCQLGDLQEHLKKLKQSLDDDVLLIYMTDASESVNFLQQHNPAIVHRDIKLANFLIQQRQHDRPVLKLCDFGLVKFLPERMDVRTFYMKTFCGSPCFMAPEFFTEDYLKYDKSVDVFSLGLVFQVLINYDGNEEYLQPRSVEMRKDKLVLFFGQEVAIAQKRGGKMPTLFTQYEATHDLRSQLKKCTESMVRPTAKERTTAQQVRDMLQKLKLEHIENRFVASLCARKKMQIFVETSFYGRLVLDVQPHNTIEDVKSKISDKKGIPINQQRLIVQFLGKQLQNYLQLHEYNIQNGSTLELRLECRPNADRTDPLP